MSSLLASLSNLLTSLLATFKSLLNTLLSAFTSVLALFQNLLTSIFDLMSGLVGFILGNIVIIGVILAAAVGYSAYRQKTQGGGIAAAKKRS